MIESFPNLSLQIRTFYPQRLNHYFLYLIVLFSIHPAISIPISSSNHEVFALLCTIGSSKLWLSRRLFCQNCNQTSFSHDSLNQLQLSSIFGSSH